MRTCYPDVSEENRGTVPVWTSEETMLKQYRILQQERDKDLPKEIEVG